MNVRPSGVCFLVSVLTLALTLTLAGCSSPGPDIDPDTGRELGPSGSRDSSEVPAELDERAISLPDIDPPMAFDAAPVVEFDSDYGEHLVRDGVIYLSTARRCAVTGYDLAAGVPIELPVLDFGSDVPLVNDDGELVRAGSTVAEVDGRIHLFCAVIESVEGVGTARDRMVLHVVAFDVDSGAAIWDVVIDDGELGFLGDKVADRFVGVNADHVVLHVDRADGMERGVMNPSEGFVVLDTTSGDLRWGAPDDTAYLLLDDLIVVGSDHSAMRPTRLFGQDTFSQAVAWEFDEAPLFARVRGLSEMLDIVPIDAELFSVTAKDRIAGADSTFIVSGRTGKVAYQVDDVVAFIDLGGPTCVDDGVGRLVCSYGGSYSALAGYDLASGDLLWSIVHPDPERVVPHLTAVRNGVIYAARDARGDGPMLLDAATGVDLDPAVAVAPQIVGAGYGIVCDEETCRIHLATDEG